ncbi:unnamed protein product [Clonostachys chloroleuca]|uniref:Uncharacterized protein n=1 Tax=Clonostachys chloroleuca TaxID=1926264 RepID=A0AA35M8C8_9HYPO|nr:unnamed protein product [Clonostachys chloroleuca]
MSLFNRVRRAVSGPNQVGVDPHDWKLPSSYSVTEPKTNIPNPKIFSTAYIPGYIKHNTAKNPFLYPDIGHAAVHLVLLECFWKLRLSANGLDDEFEGLPTYEEVDQNLNVKPDQRATRKWNTLIKLAVTRFEVWWSNIDRILDHASNYGRIYASERTAIQLSKDYLPPLDVLLVWYAFILNSRSYHLECRRSGRVSTRVLQLAFPWPALREIIDPNTMTYDLPLAARNRFSTLSGQSSDIFVYLKAPPAYIETESLTFGIDLCAEVKRHENFIDQAHHLLWIRGPALRGSLERASVQYFDAQLNHGMWMSEDDDLPFGVKLLWRTHLLFPAQYEHFLEIAKGTYGGSDLKEFFLQHSPLPNTNTHMCICWTCERIRDDLPTFKHTSYTNSVASSSSDQTHHTLELQLSTLSAARFHQILDDIGFHHAVEGARKNGKPLPTRPPTKIEQEAEKVAKGKQKAMGYLPGVNEYFERMPDGSYKVRKHKAIPGWGTAWAF